MLNLAKNVYFRITEEISAVFLIRSKQLQLHDDVNCKIVTLQRCVADSNNTMGMPFSNAASYRERSKAF